MITQFALQFKSITLMAFINFVIRTDNPANYLDMAKLETQKAKFYRTEG